jgi:type IV pilus assembly protein PilE
MERNYTVTNRYNRLPGDASDRNSAGMTAQLPYQQVPREGGTDVYNLSVSALGTNTFTLQAVPTGAQSGDPCGTLTLTNTGVKDVSGGSYTKNQCW